MATIFSRVVPSAISLLVLACAPETSLPASVGKVPNNKTLSLPKNGATQPFGAPGPFSLSKTIPNTVPQWNVADKVHIKRGPSQTRGTVDFGVRIPEVAVEPGATIAVYAKQQFVPYLSLPEFATDLTLYSPTLMPPNHSTIEVSTAYLRKPKDISTFRYFGVYDQVKGDFGVLENATYYLWQETYTEEIDGKQWYNVIITLDYGIWKAFIWNYKFRSWEFKYGATGNWERADGWDVFEAFFHGLVPSLPSTASRYLSLSDGKYWWDVNEVYGQEVKYYDPHPYFPYAPAWFNLYSSWAVN
jgi:hypothetical protein